MNKSRSSSGGGSKKRLPQFHSDDKVQYLLSAEEQLLQSISTGAPLPEVLNGICSALDCQIADVVSLISLPGDNAGELAEIAMHAAFFGLYTFCSEGVVGENDELLGSLEMYCSVRRSPSIGEFQLIERAKCLAAIAIKLDNQAGHRGKCGTRENEPVRGQVLEWPVSMN
jgi:hypothetical protein